MPPDFTTYDITVTDATPIVKDTPCQPNDTYIFGDAFGSNCDGNDHVDLTRATIVSIATPTSDGKCIITSYYVTERYHTELPCDEDIMEWLQNEPNARQRLWRAIVSDTPAPTPVRTNVWNGSQSVPSVTYERPEPGKQCSDKSGHKISFEKRCVNGKWVVTRIVDVTVATPIIGGRCHVMKFQRREPVRTDLDCDELDFVDMTDAEILWTDGVKKMMTPETPGSGGSESSGQGNKSARMSPGTEWTVPKPFDRAVADIRKKEKAAGERPEKPNREVHFETTEGEEVISPADIPVDAGKLYVKIEDSEHRVLVYFSRKPDDSPLNLETVPEGLRETLSVAMDGADVEE